MKFGDKLFFAMTAVLTVIFTVFGTWMLSSYFGQLLNREIVQIDTEGQMYQYLYEMAYQSLQYAEILLGKWKGVDINGRSKHSISYIQWCFLFE